MAKLRLLQPREECCASTSSLSKAALKDILRSDPEVSSHVHILPILAMNAHEHPASSIYLFREDDRSEALPWAEAKEVVQLVCARVRSDDGDLQPPAALDGR